MNIDSHQHFWKYHPVRNAWIDNSMKVIQRDFLPEDLYPILKDKGIGGCIAVQADQSEEETNFLLQCAQNNSFIKGVIGWVDLRAENVDERLDHFSKDKNFKGVRHIVQAETDDAFMLKPKFLNGISKLEQFGLTYDILIHQHQLKQAIAMVNKFPKQKFVLDHIAKPKISEGIDAEWKNDINLLATHENVFCKISGLVTETENHQWIEPMFKPFLDTVIKAFGINRLLFGSDWPVCLLAGAYQEVLQIITNNLSNFSEKDRAKVMGGNASRVYNLNI
jgi:L-fuconolactonase